MGTNLSEILIEIHKFSFKKMRFKLSFGKWRTFRLGLSVLIGRCVGQGGSATGLSLMVVVMVHGRMDGEAVQLACP